MNRNKRIQSILSSALKEWSIEVYDTSYQHSGHNNFDGKQETHFKIIFKNKLSNKPNRLSFHRKINNLLENEFTTGLHALEIKII